MWKNRNRIMEAGTSLIELLVAIGLFAIIAPALLTGFVAVREGRPQQEQHTAALALAQEALESVRVVRERSWLEFAQNGSYHPAIVDNTWVLQAGSETVGDFTREIIISSVDRDNYQLITLLGGRMDPSTKHVNVRITWNMPRFTSYETSAYFTRYMDNLSQIFTTIEDFSQPGYELEWTEFTTEFGDGEIKLSASGPGRGNWCQPNMVGQLDLPRNGEATALTAIPGDVFVGTGANASGVSLAYVTVTDTIPPISTLAGTFDGYKTNDVFGEEGYAYLATDTNSKEVVIISTSTMTEVGYFDSPGVTDAQSIIVTNNTGLVVTGNILYTFDLSSKTGSRPQLGSITLAGTATSVYVVGDYAYVTNSSTTNQLQIIDISNPTSLTARGSLTLNAMGGKDVYVAPDGERAYVVTGADPARPEFFLINSVNKDALSVISTYDTNGMDPRAVDMVLSGNRAIIVGTGGEEYQVINIAPETNPVRCGGLNDDTGIYDIGTVVEEDGDAYAYITSGQSSSELKIIEGGPGGSFSLTGTYISPPLDAGFTTMFNRFTPEATLPEGTSLSYQIAVADAVGGSCNDVNYSFVGPNLNPDTWFAAGGAIPPDDDGVGYENPGQCLKYKVYFETTNMLATPIFEQMTINYSP